jgi:hypothetical protein
MNIKKTAHRLLLLLPTFGAACWSIYPAALAFLAMFSLQLPNHDAEALTVGGAAEKLSRTIQSHFLAYETYIPLEDVWVEGSHKGPESERLSLLMRKTCGRGNLYVWIPFSFRLPFLGNRTLEWCWKPEPKMRKPDVSE